MKCKYCGSELGGAEKFCSACGAPVKDSIGQHGIEDTKSNSKVDTGSNTSPIHEARQQTELNMSQDVPKNIEKERTTKKKSRLPLLGGIVAVIVLFAVLGSGGSKESNSESSGNVSAKNEVKSIESTSEAEESSTFGESKETTENIKSYRAIDFYEGAEKAFENDNSINLKISDKARKFLQDHDDLFPARTALIDENYVDRTVDVRSINKNSEKYGDKLISIPELYVNQITETNITEDEYASEIIGWDEAEQIYYIIYNDELPEVFEKDVVSVIGLPLCSGSFTNIERGDTLAIYIAASEVKKYNSGIIAESEASQQTENSKIIGKYYCEYNRSSTYAEVQLDSSEGNYVMDVVRTYADGEGVPDKKNQYIITTSDGYAWRAEGDTLQLTFNGSDQLHIIDNTSYVDETLTRMPVGYDIPEVSEGAYLLPDSDSRYLKNSDVDWMNDETLRLAVNEIFARRGRRFNSQDLQDYFDNQPWYHGTIAPEDFNDQILNSYEKENAKMISDLQEKRKQNGNSGDPDAITYYYQSTTLSSGETVNDSLEPVSLRVNEDGTATFTGLGHVGILPKDDEYYYAGWVDGEMYVMVAKFGITVEEGDCAYYFER